MNIIPVKVNFQLGNYAAGVSEVSAADAKAKMEVLWTNWMYCRNYAAAGSSHGNNYGYMNRGGYSEWNNPGRGTLYNGAVDKTAIPYHPRDCYTGVLLNRYDVSDTSFRQNMLTHFSPTSRGFDGTEENPDFASPVTVGYSKGSPTYALQPFPNVTYRDGAPFQEEFSGQWERIRIIANGIDIVEELLTQSDVIPSTEIVEYERVLSGPGITQYYCGRFNKGLYTAYLTAFPDAVLQVSPFGPSMNLVAPPGGCIAELHVDDSIEMGFGATLPTLRADAFVVAGYTAKPTTDPDFDPETDVHLSNSSIASVMLELEANRKSPFLSTDEFNDAANHRYGYTIPRYYVKDTAPFDYSFSGDEDNDPVHVGQLLEQFYNVSGQSTQGYFTLRTLVENPYVTEEDQSCEVKYKLRVLFTNPQSSSITISGVAVITYSDGATDSQNVSVTLAGTSSNTSLPASSQVVDVLFTHTYSEGYKYSDAGDSPTKKTSVAVFTNYGNMVPIVADNHRPIVSKEISLEYEREASVPGGTIYYYKVKGLEHCYDVDSPLGNLYVSNTNLTTGQLEDGAASPIFSRPSVDSFSADPDIIYMLRYYPITEDDEIPVWVSRSDNNGEKQVHLRVFDSFLGWKGKASWGMSTPVLKQCSIVNTDDVTAHVVSICEDHDGVMYTALAQKDETGQWVEIRKFKSDIHHPYVLTKLQNEGYGVIYHSSESSALYVITQNLDNKLYYLRESANYGEEWGTPMIMPFGSGFKSVRGHGMQDGGHVAVGLKKDGSVWFSRSSDGVNWKPLVYVTTNTDIRGADVYQMNLSGSSQIVITDGSSFMVGSKDFGATWQPTDVT